MRPPLWCCRLWVRFFAAEPDWLKELRKDAAPSAPRRFRPNPVGYREWTLIGTCGFLSFGAGWIALSDPNSELAVTGDSGPAALHGQARVIDGDTLDFSGARVRLDGIDAPETDQHCRDRSGRTYPCGQTAAAALRGKIAGQHIRCEAHGTDRYGRHLGRCFAGNIDLGDWLVREGQAVAYWRYTVRYVPAEFTARFDNKGIWEGDFERPENWRQSHPRGGRN